MTEKVTSLVASEIAGHIDRAVERERARANSVAATIRLSGGGVFLLLSLALWQFAGLWDWGVYVPLLALYTALAVPAYVFRRHLVAFGGLMAVADVVVVYVLQRLALPVSPFPSGVAGFSLGLFALLVSLGSLTLSSATGFAVASISTIAQLALMHQAGVSEGPMVAAAVVLLLIAVIGHTNLVRLRIVCADLAKTEAVRQTEQRRFAEIEHASQTIERKLREAQEANEHLGQMQRDKEALLQTLVHDMRSPLTDILVSLDCAAEARPEGSGSALRDTLDEVKVSAKRIARMVTEMLDVAKLEEGRLVLERSPVRLGGLVEAVRKQSEPMASERAVSIDVECAEAATAEVDLGLMTRVLENLMANAIRHAPRGDRILIALRADRNGPVISVHNNGLPIPRELRQQVFEKFARGNDERRPGWGLGLFFCRLAMDAHGGSIAVEDVPGWSTSLVIRLPHPDHARVPAA